jgi:hypothetical protein
VTLELALSRFSHFLAGSFLRSPKNLLNKFAQAGSADQASPRYPARSFAPLHQDGQNSKHGAWQTLGKRLTLTKLKTFGKLAKPCDFISIRINYCHKTKNNQPNAFLP